MYVSHTIQLIVTEVFPFAFLSVHQGAINESGLGLLSWWDQQNQPADDAGEEFEE